jgi:hypothetical protein
MKQVLFFSLGLLTAAIVPSRAGVTAPSSVPVAHVDQRSPLRLALLVGISKYRQVTTNAWPRLHAHKDVAEMKRVLMKPQYGFREEDILVLEDQAATAEGIRKAFKEHLITKARPGAVVVIHVSGHGQQVADQNGDELDGLDETIVPYDATDQSASEGATVNIRDDEIADWLSELQAKMRRPDGKVDGSINVFLDSCFSGTATRGTLVERGRGWDESLDGPKPAARVVAAASRVGTNSLRDAEGDYVFISASQSDQRAREVGGMGLFTRALVGALERATERTTYRDLLNEVSTEVMAEVRNQVPQLEGNPDLRLFSGTVQTAAAYVPVARVRGEHLTLPIGELHLVTPGSVYAIHRAGTEPLSDQTLLGEAEVISVNATESQLRFKSQTPSAQVSGARAVEKAHNYGIRPLRVLTDNLSTQPQLEKSLQALGIVTTKGVTQQNYHVAVRVTATDVELRRPEEGAPITTIPLLPETELSDHLAQILKAEWRWRQLADLRQPNPDVQVRLRLVPVSAAPNAQGRVATPPVRRADLAPSQRLTLQEGDYYQMEIANPTKKNLWVTVLELDATGRIALRFPLQRQAGEGLIRAGNNRLVPLPYVFQVTRPLNPSVFKVIATDQKVDLGMLVQSAYATGQAPLAQRGSGELSRQVVGLLKTIPGPLNPLACMLAEAAQGQRQSTTVAAELGSWGVTDAVLLQVPRH